jgi:hypothetical protein
LGNLFARKSGQVAPEKSGLLFDPANEADLANCLDRLSGDAQARTMTGWNSLEHIRRWDCDNFARNALRAVSAALAGTPLSS